MSSFKEKQIVAGGTCPEVFDVEQNVAENDGGKEKIKATFWGSSRMAYTICAFLAMVMHLCLRNTINYVILCMVKSSDVGGSTNGSTTSVMYRCGLAQDNEKGTLRTNGGELEWSRAQQFTLQGSFYFGYIFTLPIAGILSDKFGGKLFFVHSITGQALVFLLTPYFSRISYTAAVIIRVIQGLIAGCGNPAIYQMFSTWAHPTEVTALLSFAYGGFSVGTVIVFPISSFLCKFGWHFAFYVIGGISLGIGICFNWFIYNRIEDHPRISRKEADYLKSSRSNVPTKPKIREIPWRDIGTSAPVYAFVLTHIFHSYGIIVFSLMIPRYLREAMGVPLSQVGLLSAAPFVGAFISKAITIFSCGKIESRPNLNLTRFRRIVYVLCNIGCIFGIMGIIFAHCSQQFVIIFMALCLGVGMDLGFSGVYWPSLLNVAPAYSGLLSGLANCLATSSGFLVPIFISNIVANGTKSEWDYVMGSVAVSYGLGAVVYGMFGSSILQSWAKNNPKETPK